MAYDKLPLLTILLNTIGSCIMIALGTIGVLSVYSKRSHIWDVVSAITAVLGMLLLIGVLLRNCELLPDRMYPMIQMSGIVFLAGGGIMWLSKLRFNSLDGTGYNISCGVIPILIVSMITVLIFFSASSTISGLDTSLFTGEKIAYHKFYDTTFENVYANWKTMHISSDSLVSAAVPLDDNSEINVTYIAEDTFFSMNNFYYKTGFAVWVGPHIGEYYLIRISPENGEKLQVLDRVYDNRMINLYYRPLNKNISI